jgi:hypothetical protein
MKDDRFVQNRGCKLSHTTTRRWPRQIRVVLYATWLVLRFLPLESRCRSRLPCWTGAPPSRGWQRECRPALLKLLSPPVHRPSATLPLTPFLRHRRTLSHSNPNPSSLPTTLRPHPHPNPRLSSSPLPATMRLAAPSPSLARS